MTQDNNIKALNEVTETLIDSYKGYEKSIEISDDSYALRQNFQNRAKERAQLVNEFQNEVRQLGGEPKTEGTMLGKAHRAFESFTALFQDDERAAVSAIDDGEDYLAKKCEGCLEDTALAPKTRELVSRAHASARAGERFADMLD